MRGISSPLCVLFVAGTLSGCTGIASGAHGSSQAAAVAGAASASMESSEGVPPSSPRIGALLPAIAQRSATLATGSTTGSVPTVVVAETHGALVDVRVVVRDGSAWDGEHPGVAAVTAELVRAALQKDSLTSAFTVSSSVDRMVVRGRVLPDELEPSLTIVGRALFADRSIVPDVRTAAQRVEERGVPSEAEVERAGDWLVRRDLFVSPIGRHPYAPSRAAHDDLAKIDKRIVDDHRKQRFTGANVTVVAVGPTTLEKVDSMVGAAFSGASLASGPAFEIDEPAPVSRPMHVYLVDRKGQRSAAVVVGRLGLHGDEEGAVATRLFGEVMGRRVRAAFPGLAIGFRWEPLLEAPSVGIVEAKGVTPERASLLIGKLGAADLTAMADANETSWARGAYDDLLGATVDAPGGLADLLAEHASVGQSATQVQHDAVEASTTSPEALAGAAARLGKSNVVAVVIGDAATFAGPLSEVSEVDVVDPLHGYARVRTVPRRAGGKLPIERENGDDHHPESPSK